MVAVMANQFNKAMQDEIPRQLFSKAQIIDELETTLPAWLRPNEWYPPFIHVLKARQIGRTG